MIKTNSKSVFGVIAGLVIALSLVIGAGVASALTVADIDMLAALGIISADKVASAKAALTTTQFAGLKIGSTGAEVIELQNKLISGGYLVMPAGVKTGYYGALTATAYAKYQAAQVVVTPVSTSTNSGSGKLNGDAGTLALTTYTTNVESKATESKSDVKILGFKAEASDSDISITNVKLTLDNENYTNSSKKLSNYIDSIDIYMGSKKVGSADASDFTRTSGSPETYTKAIALSNAVVKEGSANKQAFYVVVNSGSIDTDNLDARWKVVVDSVRYVDGSGVTMSDSYAGTLDKTFTYENSIANDNLSIKTSSKNPVASTIEVKKNDSTDGVLIGAFNLKADVDSSDIKINEIPVVLTFAANGTTSNKFAANVIDTLKLSIDGTSYDATLKTSDDNTLKGSGTSTYYVDLNDEDVTISAGDTAEVKIYADINEQDTNYANDTTVKASVDAAAIDAEGADTLGADQLDGSFTGKVQTLEVNAVGATLSSGTTVTTTGTSDSTASPVVKQKYVATFNFKVTASADQDIYLPLNTFAFGTAGTQGIEYTEYVNGVAIVNASLTSSADKGDNGYIVYAGDSETFTFKVTLEGNDANNVVDLTGIWYETTDSVANGTPAITTGLKYFEASGYMSKF